MTDTLSRSDTTARPRPGWTAREALACAYCWAEFHNPEDRSDTPETYWLRITERARNECRAIANDRLLLAVARGQAVAVPPTASLRAGQFEALKAALSLKMDHRVRQILDAIVGVLRPAERGCKRAD